ncbi:zinc finger, CCHC-type containing protein [Tanacetum coccineum]
MSPCTKLGDHVDEYNMLIPDLANTYIEIKDQDLALMLLMSLLLGGTSKLAYFIFHSERHLKRDFPIKKSNGSIRKGKNDQDSDSSNDEGITYFGEALVVVENDEMTELVMDSGNNRTCTIKETEKVKILLHDGSSFIQEDVRLVPGLRRSLISLVQGNREAEVFHISNNDPEVAQRRLKDKQLEENTNTDCLVKEREKVHIDIKVGENIMVTRISGQEGAEDNVAKKKKVGMDRGFLSSKWGGVKQKKAEVTVNTVVNKVNSNDDSGFVNDTTKDNVVLSSAVDEPMVASGNNKGTKDGNVGPGVTPITTTALNTSSYFSSKDGPDAMLENGPWFIRNNSFTLKKWNQDVNLQKEDVGHVQVWVKFPDISMTSFSEDGLSIIATKLAMIELRADEELKDTIVVAMPKLVGEGFNMCTIRVEYEWKPPRCLSCKVFGHHLDACLKKIVSNVKTLNNPRQATRSVPVSPNVSFKSTKQIYIRVYNKNVANTSGKKKQAKVSRQEVRMRGFQDGKLLLMDDVGKSLPKVVSTVNADSDSEVEECSMNMQILWNQQG